MNKDPQFQKILGSLQSLCVRQECCSRDIYAKALKRLKAAGAGTADGSISCPPGGSSFTQGGSSCPPGGSSFTQGGRLGGSATPESSSAGGGSHGPETPESGASAIVEALIADGFVNDLRYAGAFVREKSAITGWGPHKIRMALRAKGIADDLISQALETVEQDKADSRLEKLILSKARSLEGDPQARLKLIRYALSRGYEWDSINAILQKLG